MVRMWVWLLVTAVLVLGAADPVLAQGPADANVQVEFLESEVVLAAAQNVTTSLRITADLECLPGQPAPATGIVVIGYSGLGGSMYETGPEPSEVEFAKESGDTYVIDEVVDVWFRSIEAPEVEVNNTVHYGTQGGGSNDSCTLRGWRAQMAEGTAINLRILPLTTEPEESGTVAILPAVIVCALIALGARRGPARNDAGN